jgi:hypothetical protein
MKATGLAWHEASTRPVAGATRAQPDALINGGHILPSQLTAAHWALAGLRVTREVRIGFRLWLSLGRQAVHHPGALLGRPWPGRRRPSTRRDRVCRDGLQAGGPVDVRGRLPPILLVEGDPRSPTTMPSPRRARRRRRARAVPRWEASRQPRYFQEATYADVLVTEDRRLADRMRPPSTTDPACHEHSRGGLGHSPAGFAIVQRRSRSSMRRAALANALRRVSFSHSLCM